MKLGKLTLGLCFVNGVIYRLYALGEKPETAAGNCTDGLKLGKAIPDTVYG